MSSEQPILLKGISVRILLQSQKFAQIGTSAIKWERHKSGDRFPSNSTIKRIVKSEGLAKKTLLIYTVDCGVTSPVGLPVTDSEGNYSFSFEGLEPGRYLLYPEDYMTRNYVPDAYWVDIPNPASQAYNFAVAPD